MAKREITPASGGELIRALNSIADALYADLKQDSPNGDRAFDTRLHTLILMLQRFEKQAKGGLK